MSHYSTSRLHSRDPCAPTTTSRQLEHQPATLCGSRHCPQRFFNPMTSAVGPAARSMSASHCGLVAMRFSAAHAPTSSSSVLFAVSTLVASPRSSPITTVHAVPRRASNATSDATGDVAPRPLDFGSNQTRATDPMLSLFVLRLTRGGVWRDVDSTNVPLGHSRGLMGSQISSGVERRRIDGVRYTMIRSRRRAGCASSTCTVTNSRGIQ